MRTERKNRRIGGGGEEEEEEEKAFFKKEAFPIDEWEEERSPMLIGKLML